MKAQVCLTSMVVYVLMVSGCPQDDGRHNEPTKGTEWPATSSSGQMPGPSSWEPATSQVPTSRSSSGSDPSTSIQSPTSSSAQPVASTSAPSTSVDVGSSSSATNSFSAPPTCNYPMAACGGLSRCEIHLLNDSNHCGACGHSCHGAGCLNGECSPRDIYAYNHGGSHPSSIVVSNNKAALLFDEDMTIWTLDLPGATRVHSFRVPKVGQTATSSGNFRAFSLALNERCVYALGYHDGYDDWYTWMQRADLTQPNESVTVRQFAMKVRPGPIYATKDHVYLGYQDNGSTWIARIPADGDALEVLNCQGDLSTATQDAENVYMASKGPGGGILVLTKATGECRTILISQGIEEVGQIKVLGDQLILCASQLNVQQGWQAAFMQVGVDGTTPPTTLRILDGLCRDFAASQSHLYYLDHNRVMRAPVSGGAPVLWYAAPGDVDEIYGLFQSEYEVFWVEEDDFGPGEKVVGRAM